MLLKYSVATSLLFFAFNLVCFPLWKGCMNATLIKHVDLGAGGQFFKFFSAI